jgi:multidrug transporter EmrE-like cation transporter
MPKIENIFIIILPLFLANIVFNILAITSFKLSALRENWKVFLIWQVVGNLAGFLTVLTLTGLLKYLDLHVAFPITTGLAIIGVQLVGAKLIFHESITPQQWFGTLCILTGVFFLQK